MRSDMEKARALGKSVYAAHAGEDGTLLPSRAVMAEIAAGADPAALSDEGVIDGDEALTESVRGGNACLFWYGETGLLFCRGMSLPALVTCAPESFTARALMGQFMKRGLCAVYVPAGFDIVPFVPMARRTLASFRQFAQLCATHGEGVYDMDARTLYARWPEMFFSVYDETDSGLPEGIVLPDCPPGSGGWYADFCSRRDRAIEALLNALPGVRSLNGWFELDTFTQKPVPWDAIGEARGILVHGVLADRASGASVRLSAGQPIPPRALLRGEKDVPQAQIISNYLFFLTPRLAELYNRLRAARPQEQSAMRGGHLDYMLYHDADGKRTETFPLYRKACMGLTGEGRFVFFHFRLRGGSCAVNGQAVEWTEADVDPADAGDVAVYTPCLSCADASANRFEYVKSVGEGRVNFVINQTELTCARDGDVLLPGTGVVLSLSRERGLALARACGFTPSEKGYFAWSEAPRLAVRLQNPEEIAPETWRGMQWAYGGGLTLIRNGESVFRRGADASEKLAEEGWASPLSAQTQESDIAALARHPRTAIGRTRAGALLILVFSGRSSLSAGADYVEMCEIARKLAPDVDDLMNVDGGGSAVLGFAIGRRFVEYSWPSSSFDSLPGMVRPVNSLFCVTLDQ
ncbi:MAG: phosphodiester glycosidase family protein, partial [Clostridia bacterium]|nr:phosphodiester glycosidase family protein [Clostridia bacterium]